jgi:hypothetical protein
MSGHAQDVYATGGVFDDEERVELVQVDRVEVEQVAGEDAVGLRAEELSPAGFQNAGIAPDQRFKLPPRTR